jgi:hypothetical protein
MYRDYQTLTESPKANRPKIATIARQWMTARKTVFCWDDPKPALVWGFRTFGARLKKFF